MSTGYPVHIAAVRKNEQSGRDYYFLSRSAIASLPGFSFFIGPVRDMLQAVDLDQLEQDLRRSDVVLIEIFDALWPGVEQRIKERLGDNLSTKSVFMMALDPDYLRSLPDDSARSKFIVDEVTKIITTRGKDDPADIPKRATSAAREVLAAIGPEGAWQYARIFHSAPEGPDGKDDWTCEGGPIRRAKKVIEEFIAFVKGNAAALSPCNKGMDQSSR